MHNPAAVLENEIHKFLCDFEKQTDHLISVKWPDLVIVNKLRELAELWTRPFQLDQSKDERTRDG